MVALWGSGTSNPKAIPGEQGQAGLPKMINGIDSAFTWNLATLNPGTAGGSEYDTSDHGSPWWDIAVASGSSALNPMLHCWLDDGTAGSVMRRLCWHYMKWLDAPIDLTGDLGTIPRLVSDGATWTAIDMTSKLSGQQEIAGKHISHVLIYLEFSNAATGTHGIDDSYIAFRKKGVAATAQKVPTLAQDTKDGRWVIVALDVGDELEFQIQVSTGGTPSFDVTVCEVQAYFEDF